MKSEHHILVPFTHPSHTFLTVRLDFQLDTEYQTRDFLAKDLMLLSEFSSPCRVVIFYPGKRGCPRAWSVTDGSRRWARIHSAERYSRWDSQQRLQNDQTTQDDLFPSSILSVNLFTRIFLLFTKFQLMLSLFAMTQEIHHTSFSLQHTSLSDSNRFIISTSVFGNERKDSNPSFKERFSSTVNNNAIRENRDHFIMLRQASLWFLKWKPSCSCLMSEK